MSEKKADVIKIKKRGVDGNRVISIRIKESTLASIDDIASKACSKGLTIRKAQDIIPT